MHFSSMKNLNLNITVSVGDNFSIILFKVSKNHPSEIKIESDQNNFLDGVKELTSNMISKGIYLDGDLRGFGSDFFYIIKKTEFRLWHEAIAHQDLSEIMQTINEASNARNR